MPDQIIGPERGEQNVNHKASAARAGQENPRDAQVKEGG
jgi:hypothetical protein